MIARDVLVTGSTGYVGRALGERLVARGIGCGRLRAPIGRVFGNTAFEGDALDARSIARGLMAGGTLVHPVGTPQPSPARLHRSCPWISRRSSRASMRRSGSASRTWST